MPRPTLRALLCCATLGVLLALGACQSSPTAAAEGESAGNIFFPIPPDSPRIQYLTWYTGEEQLAPENRSSFESFVLGDERRVRPRLVKPFGLAARDGVLYVCDSRAFFIAKLDFKNKTFTTFGTEGMGRLQKPINIAVDELGYKFVADAVRNEIVVFGPDDHFVRSFPITGAEVRVVDVALYGNELFVLNNLGAQIVVMDRVTGEVRRTIGRRGAEPGEFSMPSGIAISPDGHIYTCDPLDCRIQKLTLDGQPVWSKGGIGNVMGSFGRPRGIDVGPDGIVYVADAATSIVQMWNGDGEVLMYFGGPANKDGGLVLPSTVAVDPSSVAYFKEYLHSEFEADYLLFAASQFGARLVTVYAFGSFPENYDFSGSEFETIAPLPPSGDSPLGPVDGSDMEDGGNSSAAPGGGAPPAGGQD